ncbi:hypothetical protein [Nocardioides bruguierae]|uniref:hypothetical protein n=1 Tax=Nocardioides bruguierae TaxID=2945102 RepID=UPI0020215A19|nr:hypothetical protein [Nocardioides bruguierae]MCL8026337.1 hypothetical protein [Nocardioides bruguierae]
MTPDDHRHGTPAGGRAHRKAGQDLCTPCHDAEARYQRGLDYDHHNGRRRRSEPATGTRLRLRALVALGHSVPRIGEALGISQTAANQLLNRPKNFVWTSTADRVRELYRDWSMTLPPSDTQRDRYVAARARGYATRRGWLPPLALDDARIDDPTYRPRRHVPRTERRALDLDLDEVYVDRLFADPRARTRALTNREAQALYDRLTAHGHTGHDIETTWGLNAARYATPSTTPTSPTGDTAA